MYRPRIDSHNVYDVSTKKGMLYTIGNVVKIRYLVLEGFPVGHLSKGLKMR